MKEYEVIGHLQIPVFVTVKADTPAEALEKGQADIDNGLGVHGDAYLEDEYAVFDPETLGPVLIH
jgi:hypothetical protein